MECNDMMDMLTVRMAEREGVTEQMCIRDSYTADLASDGEVIRGYLNGGTFSYEGERCV